jgi:hypothetical protein
MSVGCQLAGHLAGLAPLPERSHTLCIQLDDFFELNILDAQLLDQEGENTLLRASAGLPKLEPIEVACLKT